VFNTLKRSLLVVSFAVVGFGCGPELDGPVEETIGVSESSLRTSWSQLPGLAYDIGVGANEQAWVIGTNPTPGGFGIFRWTGSSWAAVEGAAVRIAVDPQGLPWIVNNAGNIFRRGASSWQLMPGLAKDVGVGADGSVYIIGTNAVSGGFGIYRWNGTNWTRLDGGATRIAVGPDGSPWVVNSAGKIFRRAGGGWQVLPGLARDIGVSADGLVWIIGTNAVAGGFGVYYLNGSNWTRVAGGATSISGSGLGGQPWVTSDSGKIFSASFF
jgi:hypothetical protein